MSAEIKMNSFVTGHHIYKDIWSPSIGELLECKRERSNRHDPKAVAVMKNGTVAGHVPREKCIQFCRFFAMKKTITARITGGRRNNGRGLVVQCTYIIS